MANLFHHRPDPTFADIYRPMADPELQDILSDWHSLDPAAARLRVLALHQLRPALD